MLEDITPSQLSGQLFQSLLGLGLVIAEAKLSTDQNVSKLFYECKDFILDACQGDSWMERIGDICQWSKIRLLELKPLFDDNEGLNKDMKVQDNDHNHSLE